MFADLINGIAYSGQDRLKPENIKPMDSAATAVIRGPNNELLTIQKIRDVFKFVEIFTRDDKTTLMLIGVENQTDIIFDMPIKILIYDAIAYDDQAHEIMKTNLQLDKAVAAEKKAKAEAAKKAAAVKTAEASPNVATTNNVANTDTVNLGEDSAEEANAGEDIAEGANAGEDSAEGANAGEDSAEGANSGEESTDEAPKSTEWMRERISKTSRLRKGQKVLPVITFVLFLAPGQWNAPRSLSECSTIDPSDPIFVYFQDYKVNLICPENLTDDDLNLFKTGLRPYMKIARSLGDKKAMIKMIKTDPDFLNLDPDTLDAIQILANLPKSKVNLLRAQNNKGGIVLPTFIEEVYGEEIKAAKEQVKAEAEEAANKKIKAVEEAANKKIKVAEEAANKAAEEAANKKIKAVEAAFKEELERLQKALAEAQKANSATPK